MARNWSRDEPELDWEDWAGREDNRPVMGICPICNRPVFDENDDWEKDDAFELDEEIIHEDCVIEYLKLRGYRA